MGHEERVVLPVPREVSGHVSFEEPLHRAVLRRREEPDPPADPRLGTRLR